LAGRQLSLVSVVAGREKLLTVDLLVGRDAKGVIDLLEARWKRKDG